MQLDQDTVLRVISNPNPEERVRETATLFRLLSEAVIDAIHTDKKRFFSLYGGTTFTIEGQDIVFGDGLFADIEQGEEPNEFNASLCVRRCRMEARLEGGFALFHQRDYEALNNEIESGKGQDPEGENNEY